MSSYTLTPAAHYTLLAHLASHPHADVCGLLLAPAASPRAIARALPLTHTWAALSPLAEAGLALAQAHAREEKCKVVGVYVAHARAGLTEVGARAEMLARRAAEGEALVLVFDASSLPSPRSLKPFLVPASTTAAASSAAQAQALPANALDAGDEKRTAEMLEKIRAGARVRDWDDHLEDTSFDWLAPESGAPKP